MRNLRSIGYLLLAAHLLGACTFNSALNDLNKNRPPLPAIEKILLFEPDVQIFSVGFTKKVIQENEGAMVKAKLRSGIGKKLQEAGYGVAVFKPRGQKEALAAVQLVKLNFAVNRAREAHAFPNGLGEEWFPLPTVSQTTAYELPAPTAVISEDIPAKYGTNIGLIVNVYDEQKSGGGIGRDFLVGLLAGAGSVSPTFLVVNFSLIDLRDGRELWSHTEFSTTNNISSDTTQASTIESALKNFKTGQEKRVGAT